MITTGGYDQSAVVRCVKHGKRAGGIFFHTEPNEGAPADYLCLSCWIAAGSPLRISKEDFLKLQRGNQ